MKELKKELLSKGFMISKTKIYSGKEITFNGVKIGRYTDVSKIFSISGSDVEKIKNIINDFLDSINVKTKLNNDDLESFFDSWAEQYEIHVQKANILLFKRGMLWIM